MLHPSVPPCPYTCTHTRVPACCLAPLGEERRDSRRDKRLSHTRAERLIFIHGLCWENASVWAAAGAAGGAPDDSPGDTGL